MTRASVFTALFGAAVAAPVSAQYYDPCNVCQPVQPVAQTCYQTVPVTQYVPEKRTVMKPVTEYKNVEQKVTVYKPVTEQRTCRSPTGQLPKRHRVSSGFSRHGWLADCLPTGQQDGSLSVRQPTPTLRVGSIEPLTAFAHRSHPQLSNGSQLSAEHCHDICADNLVKWLSRSTRQVTYNVTKMVPETRVQTVRVPTTRMVAVEETVMWHAPCIDRFLRAPRSLTATVVTDTLRKPYWLRLLIRFQEHAVQTALLTSLSEPRKTPTRSKSHRNTSEPKTFDPFPPDAQVEREIETQVSATGGWRPTGSVVAAKPVGPKLVAPTVASNK